MEKKTPAAGNSAGKGRARRGFTLIEIVVVLVIIGIVIAISAPSLTGLVKRTQIKGYIQAAQKAEDEIMALTGLQYAYTGSGNPLFMSWSGDEAIDESAAGGQYVYIDRDASYSAEGTPLFRLAPANEAAPMGLRESEGLTEFYKRTMNGLPAPEWRGATGEGEFENRMACSAYFFLEGSNIDADVSAVDAGRFVSYSLAYSEHFMTADGRHMALYHGLTLHSPGASAGDAIPDTPPAAIDRGMGWHVYIASGGSLSYYGSFG